MELQAQIIREVARQGLLPFPSFFSSTKPFGTPLGPVALKGCLTVIVILLLPAKDAFNFVVDLASYSHLVGDLPHLRPASLTLVVSRFKVFQPAMSAGVWILRRRRAYRQCTAFTSSSLEWGHYRIPDFIHSYSRLTVVRLLHLSHRRSTL